MVYQCGDRSKKAPTGFVLISAFKADKEDKECLYSLAWSFDPSRDDLPVLAFGGLNGIVRLLSITGMGLSEDQQKNYSQLNGHSKKKVKISDFNLIISIITFIAGAINDMKFHPTSPFFLVTASQDHTIRLWNVFTKVNIAVLSGEFNRDEVLAIDFNIDGSQIISAGMDRYATIWNINTSEVNKAVDRSMLCNDHDEQPFRTIRIYYSEYCSRKVHSNYIDSIIWFGPNTFLSKSVTNEIVWWAPKPGKKNEEKQNCIILHTFKTFNCDLWFVRMALDYKRKYLALGNSTGDILLWDMDADSVKHVKRYKLSNPKLENIIRMISFSRCGRIMIACNDEGQLIRYDATG